MWRSPALLAVLVALLALALPTSGTGQGTEPMEVHFIDVGQGDSCWLRLPNGDDVLVDGGEQQAGPTVVAYLQAHGVTDIELLVATHGDSDHIGGLLDVLAALPVAEAWLDSQTCSTQTCLDFYSSLAVHGVVTATVRMGDTDSWGSVSVLVLNPSEPLYASKNENSVVLRISYGSIDFLLTGDAETGAEGRMLASGLPLDAEILKVPHHGSNSSSSSAFLTAVGPHEAVISVGPNPYGHPRAEVLQRLADVGATIWRTDESGTIVVWTSGDAYSIMPTSDGTVTPTFTHTPTPTATLEVWEYLFLPLVVRNAGAISPTPTATATPSPEATPTPSATGTGTATPTCTASNTPTATQTPTPSRTATATNTPMASPSATSTPSLTPTSSATASSTPTATRTGTATFTPTPTATTPATSDLGITALEYSGRDEYVQVTNQGGAAQDMTGWQIHSVTGNQWYDFPSGYSLQAGHWVRVHSGPDAKDEPPSHLKWSGAYLWNNEGDEAVLYDDQGTEVDSWAY